jgi:hypothetical protein
MRKLLLLAAAVVCSAAFAPAANAAAIERCGADINDDSRIVIESRSFANDDIVALHGNDGRASRGESEFLLIFARSKNQNACFVISANDGGGFAAINVTDAHARYDENVGLMLQILVDYSDRTAETLNIGINRARGVRVWIDTP